MARLLGVKIERLDKRFTELLEVGRGTSGHSRLTTLTPEQDIAEIEIYLLRRGRDASRSLSEIRRLHRFTRRHTSRPDQTRPLFELTALRRNRRKYDIQLYEDGTLQETATVRIPRSGGAVAALLLLLLALIGLGIGGRALLTSAESDTSLGTEAPTAEASPVTPPDATDTSSQVAARETASGAPGTEAPEGTGASAETAPPDETEPSDGEGARQPDEAAAHDGAAAGDAGTDAATPDPPVAATEPEVQTATVYFLPDSIQLTRDASRTLNAFLGQIGGAEIIDIRVEGHTALYGNEAGRERISRGRIDAVLSFIERSGRIPEAPPVTETFGAQAPVTRATDQQHLNRRAEIHVTYRRDER